MRLGTTHGKQARIRKSGRHAAQSPARPAVPAQLNKVVKRAALVVPGLVIAGAIGATVLGQGTASPAPANAADQVHRTMSSHDSGVSAGTGHGLAAARTRSATARAHGSPSAAPAQHRPPAGHPKPAKPAKPAPAALRCSGSSVMLPENYATIVSFLVNHGYSRFASAGIAGNIDQESKGNPESVGSGGGGLIGWTPLPPGFVTGNPAADLQTQLNALLTYNQQWAQYIPALNAATSAVQAADVYMNYFERPGLPVAYNRESAAAAVATACGF